MRNPFGGRKVEIKERDSRHDPLFLTAVLGSGDRRRYMEEIRQECSVRRKG